MRYRNEDTTQTISVDSVTGDDRADIMLAILSKQEEIIARLKHLELEVINLSQNVSDTEQRTSLINETVDRVFDKSEWLAMRINKLMSHWWNKL